MGDSMYTKKYFLVIIILIIIITITGCAKAGTITEKNDTDVLAIISANSNSQYEKTFKDLNIGYLFDFNLKINKADTSWVDIWVEGYEDGKPMEPFKLTSLSYGLSPKKTEEGNAGFGIINGDELQLFIYSAGIKSKPINIIYNFIDIPGISTWDYAIGSEKVNLIDGEEKVLAVYRKGENQLRAAYNYQDHNSIKEMITDDKVVLLLKIKVEER